jgi:hypothetical protein
MTMTRVTRHGSQDGNSRITQTHTVISSNLSLKGLTSPTNRRQSAASETQAPGEVAACPAGSEKTSCRRRRLARETPPRHGGTPRPESETDHGGEDCCKLQNMAPCVPALPRSLLSFLSLSLAFRSGAAGGRFW